MFSTIRSLVIGFSVAVIFQLFLQQLPRSETFAAVCEGVDLELDLDLGNSNTMAQSLRKPSQFARSFCRGATVGIPYNPRNNKPFSATFSTSSPAMASTKSFLDATKERRSIHALNKTIPISDKRIVELVETAATVVPSAFNSQTARLVVLLHEEHESFWDQTREVLKPIVPEQMWSGYTDPKTQAFKASYGTILFFEDPAPSDALKAKFPAFADHFGTWSEHTSAMHQYFLWTALTAEGLGANLQHYNPLVDQKIQAHWKIPQEWKLRAQLVFGGKAGEPNPDKEFKPLETKVFVHGAKK